VYAILFSYLCALSLIFAKGLNVLSGSTWKGTKLRIGDARPDYGEK
jgi:hypothetical protein